MTTLITGATGKVGRHVVARMAEAKEPFRAACRTPSGIAADAAPFDWLDSGTWRPALAGVTRLWIVPQAKGLYDVSEQVIDFLRLAAEVCAVDRVGLLSVKNAEQLNDDLPALRIERALDELGLPWFSLRPTWFFQNFTVGMFARSIAREGEIWAPAGGGRIGFVDARDIAACVVRAVSGEPPARRSYTLTGGESLTFAEAAETLSRVSGRPVRHADVSDEVMEEYLSGLGLPPAHVSALLNHFARIRADLAGELTGDVEELTGRPPITLARFAADEFTPGSA
ncbi:oxidoreductase [Streptosporangium violaceochromogenes]|nr:oxidoreductase [Streptosporangium violaceochromogenes]